jgi:hypothetical protein
VFDAILDPRSWWNTAVDGSASTTTRCDRRDMAEYSEH